MDVVSARTVAGWRSVPSDVWRYRELLRNLVIRNLKVKYQRSALGFFWTLLNPLLTLAILTTVFSYIVQIPIPHYWAFLLSGYFVWHFLQQTMGAGAYIISEHAALRRSVAFPSEVLVLGATISRLAEFAVEMTLALIVLVLFHHGGVPSSFALLPVLLVLQLLLALGLVLPISALAVFYHDLQHALPAVLLTLFYISPVFYPAHMVPEPIQAAYLVNPIAGLLTLYHTVLYEGVLPSARFLGTVAAASVILFGMGYVAFHRHKRILAETV